ncbi:MAG TPA: amidohydrolase family protein [Dongiaceae bacterium]|nr:amidohydrolase family protein [Dongiaceae bacterium]
MDKTMNAAVSEMPIVDAHHHVWRQNDLAWLKGPMQPRIFGPYEPIRRDYPIEEYLADAKPAGVEASIYCQTNWPPKGELTEVEWIDAEARRSGWPHAMTAYCNLLAEDAGDMLAAEAKASKLVRGIRMQLHWHENPLYRFQPRPDLMNERLFRQNLAKLQDHGWLFELQVFASQMKDAAALVRAFPGIPFVLLHAGMLEDLSAAGRAAWMEGMRRLAELPNMYVKLSGLGTFIHRVDEAHIADVALQTVEWFGASRCVFGSNYPIEKLWSNYAELVGAYRRALSPLSEADQARIFFGTACGLYRLE